MAVKALLLVAPLWPGQCNAGLGLEEGADGADEVQGLVCVDPVAGVWNVLDVSTREETLNLWVVLRAGGGGHVPVLAKTLANVNVICWLYAHC